MNSTVLAPSPNDQNLFSQYNNNIIVGRLDIASKRMILGSMGSPNKQIVSESPLGIGIYGKDSRIPPTTISADALKLILNVK